MAQGDRAELNLDFCARIPVYTITTGIGLDGDEALRFRHAYLNSTSSSRNVTMEDRIRNAKIVEDTLLGLIAARRAEPEDDLISFLLEMKLFFGQFVLEVRDLLMGQRVFHRQGSLPGHLREKFDVRLGKSLFLLPICLLFGAPR